MALGRKAVRVRLAPSPTGLFHFGTARTGLMNWLTARREKGVFVLRIEDTDVERSEKRFETQITDGLTWLGLAWDEGPDWQDMHGTHHASQGDHGPYRQSERIELYTAHLERLIKEKKAYYCYCTKEELDAERETMRAEGLPPRYSGHCRELSAPPKGRTPALVRFKTPRTEIVVKDIVRGRVKFDAGLFGDMVIAKNLASPLYNFAVVVDDELMGITHVIRGEDHLPNTPKQLLIQQALGFTEPIYAHVPLILGPNRAKLSKRYLETSLLDYREKGYLPEALVNFLALLGWHPKDDQEVFSHEELIRAFELTRIQKAGAIFDIDKLDWLNAQHLRRLSDKEIMERLEDHLNRVHADQSMMRDRDLLLKIVGVERERLTNISDFFEVAGFFFVLPDYDASLLAWRDTTPESTISTLRALHGMTKELNSSQLTRDGILAALTPLIEERGKGNVLWPLRVALSGRRASPDPVDILLILGKDEALRRLNVAESKLLA